MFSYALSNRWSLNVEPAFGLSHVSDPTAVKLQALGVYSAKDYRDMDIRSARKALTLVGSRMVQELRGFPAIQLEMMIPLQKNICCSRSFAGQVFSKAEIAESVISHLYTAAEKMRGQQLVANAVKVFIHTNRFKDNQYSNSATLKLIPTDSTRELIAQAMRILDTIYRPGYCYRKSRVMLLGLHSRQAQTQRLFNEVAYMRDRDLMDAIDRLNARSANRAVRPASKEGDQMENEPQ